MTKEYVGQYKINFDWEKNKIIFRRNIYRKVWKHGNDLFTTYNGTRYPVRFENGVCVAYRA